MIITTRQTESLTVSIAARVCLRIARLSPHGEIFDCQIVTWVTSGAQDFDGTTLQAVAFCSLPV